MSSFEGNQSASGAADILLDRSQEISSPDAFQPGATSKPTVPSPSTFGALDADSKGPAAPVSGSINDKGSASGSNTVRDGVTYAPGGKVRLTNYPAIANALLPAEGNGSFSNLHLGLAIFFAPAVLLRLIPYFKPSWVPFWAYLFLVAIMGFPVAIGYWTLMSRFGKRINEKVTLPGREFAGPLEFYMDIKDPELRKKYNGQSKIPMQIFYDAYFESKIEIKLPMLDLLEYRLDWAQMHMTPSLFHYVVFNLIPDVLRHSARQDEDQIRDNYDRGDDFYSWFLGPQMIYTSGVVSDIHRQETLEELQDNKLALVCSKLGLKETDRVLDIGCGWGTFTAFAAKNFGCDVTGVTLARNQTAFGNERIKKAGISSDKARILCMDYRDIPPQQAHYNKIISLEMAEHVGIKHYSKFLSDVYNLLDDDGVFVFQVAGLRPTWQYWDIIWGLYMNKYVFPGADASCSLGWVINKLEAAGFEVRSCDVLGVHYSATIHRWLENWKSHEADVKAKYGEKWWRVWLFFLASSTIIAREGGSSVFQITLTKNLNATHRIESVESHNNIHPKPAREFQSVYKY